MNKQSFAPWVEPIARTLAEDRGQLLAFVTAAEPDFWDHPSVVDGWANRDILAHLAGGNDMLVQTLLRAITSGQQLDPHTLAPDTDAENARRIAERRTWPIANLIAELERDHAEVLDWLAQLTDAHRDLRPEGLGLSVGQFLRIVQQEHHDLAHLDQLRSA